MGSKRQDDGLLVVNQGSVSVKVYKVDCEKKGRPYNEATIVWYELVRSSEAQGLLRFRNREVRGGDHRPTPFPLGSR